MVSSGRSWARQSTRVVRTAVKKTVSAALRTQPSTSHHLSEPELRKSMPLAHALVRSATMRNIFRPYVSISRPKAGVKMNSESAPEAVSRAKVELTAAESPSTSVSSIGRSGSVEAKQKTERKMAGPSTDSGFFLAAPSSGLLWPAMLQPGSAGVVPLGCDTGLRGPPPSSRRLGRDSRRRMHSNAR